MTEVYQNHEIGSLLYKRDVAGRIRTWRYEIGWNSPEDAGWRTISGLEEGAQTMSDWTRCEPKNVGRSNATTALEQATSEARNEYRKKTERGHSPSKLMVDNIEFTKPMLAQKWEDREAKVDLGEGVYTQPKLDGIRCIARSDGLWSRGGKRIVAVPHIIEALEPIFERFPDGILDGELYSHDLKDDFNEISSIVRKQSIPDLLDMDRVRTIGYHIYDVVGHATFGGRWQALGIYLKEFASPHLVPVSTGLAFDKQTLDSYYGTYLEEGYEGQMIRLDRPYEHKRSPWLLKRKEFQDAEFKVTGIGRGNGNWHDYIKRFYLVTDEGKPFQANVRGTQADLAYDKWMQSGPPDWATIRYQNLTPDGIPRFPVAVDYGWGERDH